MNNLIKKQRTRSRRNVASDERTENVYHFIIDFKNMHGGNSPTVREIQRGMSLSSTATVYWHLQKLQNQGRIELNGRAGGIVVTV